VAYLSSKECPEELEICDPKFNPKTLFASWEKKMLNIYLVQCVFRVDVWIMRAINPNVAWAIFLENSNEISRNKDDYEVILLLQNNKDVKFHPGKTFGEGS